MSRSYPIWNNVTACIYKSSKSFGARDTSETDIYVGTSRHNSEHLVSHVTTRREVGEYTVFRFGYQLPGQPLVQVAEKWMHTETREWLDKPPPRKLKRVITS